MATDPNDANTPTFEQEFAAGVKAADWSVPAQKFAAHLDALIVDKIMQEKNKSGWEAAMLNDYPESPYSVGVADVDGVVVSAFEASKAFNKEFKTIATKPQLKVDWAKGPDSTQIEPYLLKHQTVYQTPLEKHYAIMYPPQSYDSPHVPEKTVEIMKTGQYLHKPSGSTFLFYAGTFVHLYGGETADDLVLTAIAAKYYNQYDKHIHNKQIEWKPPYPTVGSPNYYGSGEPPTVGLPWGKSKLGIIKDPITAGAVEWNPEYAKPGYVNRVFDGTAEANVVQGAGHGALVDDILGAMSDG